MHAVPQRSDNRIVLNDLVALCTKLFYAKAIVYGCLKTVTFLPSLYVSGVVVCQK